MSMITGSKKMLLTIPAVLNLITEYDIFRFYMTGIWHINQITLSPFPRSNGGTENTPSFIIGNKKGSLSFIDFADTEKRGDCFEFVKTLFSLQTIDDVLKRIDEDFGLGFITGKPTTYYKRIVAEYEQPENSGKRYALVQAVTRKFTHEELAYWNGFFQDISDLRREHIYSIKELYLNKSKFSLKDTELRFGYLYDGCWKIYRPFADKKVKWVPNNVPLTSMRGLDNLNKDYNSLICDSLKDYMVCLKVYDHVAHTQNESLASFSHENVAYIKENSKEVFWGGDSDAPGKQASYVITKAFGFRHINPPDELLPSIKDWAQWGKDKGLDELRNHFIKKGLL